MYHVTWSDKKGRFHRVATTAEAAGDILVMACAMGILVFCYHGDDLIATSV
jgi:hypothetical protein